MYWNVGVNSKGQERSLTKECEKFWELMSMLIILIVEIVSQVYTYIKTYQIISSKFIQFIKCQLYVTEATKIVSILAIFYINCLYAPFQWRMCIDFC